MAKVKAERANEARSTKNEKTAKTGVISHVFASYRALCRKWEHSGIYTAASRMATSKTFSRMRRRVSRSVENSVILRTVAAFAGRLPGVTLRAYGTLLFSLGLYSVIVFIIKAVASTLTSDVDALVTSISLMIAAVPLLFSKKTLAEAVLDSKAGSFVAFDLLGYRREEAALSRRVRGRCDTPMLIGMVLGLCSFYVDILYIIAAMSAVVAIYFLLTRPESGAVMLFVLLPFMPDEMLAVYITILGCGYLFKLITGRRTMRFDPADTVMLVFAMAVFFGGVIHYGEGTYVGAYSVAPFVFVYFIITNLIKNDKWRERCRGAVMTGGALVAAVYLLTRIFDPSVLLADGFSSSVLTRLAEYVTFIADEVGDVTPYMLMILPMMVTYVFLRGRGGQGLLYIMPAALTAAAVIYTQSRSLWLGAAVGIVTLLMAGNIRFVWIPVAVVTAIPLLILVLPSSMDKYILDLLDLSGADTAARVGVRELSAQILKDNFFGGIGFSDDVFSEVYSLYSKFGVSAENSQSFFLGIAVRIGVTGLFLFLLAMLVLFIKSVSGAKNAETLDEKSVSVSSAAGLLSVLVSGVSLDIFYTEKMFLLFFMFAAFMSSYSAVKPKKVGVSENAVITRDGKTASLDIYFD